MIYVIRNRIFIVLLQLKNLDDAHFEFQMLYESFCNFYSPKISNPDLSKDSY